MINDFQLSEHFNLREFQNASCEVMIAPALIEGLEELRAKLGNIPIIITSGYRSQRDNEALAAELGWIENGGLVSKDSQHMRGTAADIVCYDPGLGYAVVPPRIVCNLAKSIFSYAKAYEAHTHVDIR